MPATARRYLIARAALRDILSRYLGVLPGSLVFAYGPYGKPGLVAPPAPLEFNLSHSGDLALLAVAADQPLGVDLEQIRPKRNLLAIAKRMFSPQEYRQLRQLQHERRLQAFFGAWTAMEAQAKARGCGIFANVADQAAPACELRHLAPAPAYLAAVAAQHLPPHPEAWRYLEPGWENPA
jgi:4'-phosphopantetheinyl transferase